uniref:Interleukin-34 n=12 Tax=Passeriformes TaxID=9126 RepID=A0A8C3QFC6_9PASS
MATINMQQGYAAVLCVLAVLGLEAAAPGECELTRLLQDKLQYEMRLQYMKHYFPIDYTVQVQYEEVLRPSNITRLRNGTVSEAALRYLWFHVSSQAVLRIREVLPEKHPSWKYTQELCQLFDALGEEYSKYRQTDVETVVADLVKLIHSAGAESRSKAVRPKALLDNCLKVMRMLYGVPCELGMTVGGSTLGKQVPHRRALSHTMSLVPSVQVGGSPPNPVEDLSLNTSLAWNLRCCLCSAPPRAPWWVRKEGARVGQMPLLPGPNTTPSRTVGLFMAVESCPSEPSASLCVADSCWGDTQPSLPTGQVRASPCFS